MGILNDAYNKAKASLLGEAFCCYYLIYYIHYGGRRDARSMRSPISAVSRNGASYMRLFNEFR